MNAVANKSISVNLTEITLAACEAEYAAACKVMKQYDHLRSDCGLTPDSVKAMPEYQAAKGNVAKAFSALREINKVVAKLRKIK
jgi:hypothetical protein